MSRLLTIVLLSGCILLGCKKEDHERHDHGHEGHSHAKASGKCEHGLTEITCPFCNPKLVKEKGMCAEHGVLEALCTQCNAALIPVFKAKNDWCAEHELPESLCRKCNPDLKFSGLGSGGSHEGHWDDEHAHDDAGDGPKNGFEWGGVYSLPAGQVRMVLQPGPDDPSMNITFLPVSTPSSHAIRSIVPEASKVFGEQPQKIGSGGKLAVGPRLYQLKLERNPMVFDLQVPRAGHYALFTEHFPHEFGTRLMAAGDEIESEAIVEFRLSRVKLTPDAVRQTGIRVEKVGRHVLRETVVVPARVSFNAEAMAHVGSPLRGRVVEIKARLGNTVNKGDSLMVVESSELGEAQLEFFQKIVAEIAAKPAVELARSAYERAKKLYDESQGISLTEVQKREGELKAAETTLASASAAVTSAANRLMILGMDTRSIDELTKGRQVHPSLEIRAPIAGQVVQREVAMGELVGPDREHLLVLADTSTLWVLAEVPETKLSQISNGAWVTITLPSLRSRTFKGAVSYISPNLNPVTRSTTVRIEVAGNQTGLRPGMFAEVEIAVGDSKDPDPVLAVPEESVQTIEGQAVVFIAEDAPGAYIKRVVKVGPPIGRMVRVLDGLAEGERVVVSGSFILKADLGKAGAAHEH